MQAEGVNGSVAFDGKIVSIRHSGLAGRAAGRGEKRIPVSQITAVQLKPAGGMTRGFIQFTIPGGNEVKGGTSNAAKDENSVLFNRKQQAGFEALRTAIESAMP